jgi:uncharacterized membrane protein YfcA
LRVHRRGQPSAAQIDRPALEPFAVRALQRLRTSVDMLELVLLLLFTSAAAGFVGAIFGIGGGVLIVPVLTLLMAIPVRAAIGVSLISVVATSAGASAAFVRDHWTNLRVAMALEVATVSGALVGAAIAGMVSPRVLEGLFAVAMLASAVEMLRRHRRRAAQQHSDRLAGRLRLGSTYPSEAGPVAYGVRRVSLGAALMAVAGVASGMLGIGAGVLKVTAMDSVMGLPFKVSSATSNFMIGVTAGAGALVYLARGDVSPVLAAPVALGVAAGALAGSRMLVRWSSRLLRPAFVVLLLFVAVEMAWRALRSG